MPCKVAIAFLVVLIVCSLSLQYSNAMFPTGGKSHSQPFSPPSSPMPGDGTAVQEPVQVRSDDTDSMLVGNNGFLKATPRVGTTFDLPHTLPPVPSSESSPFATLYHKKKARTATQQSSRWYTLDEPVGESSPIQSRSPERIPARRRNPYQASEDDDHSQSTSRLQVPSSGNYRNTGVKAYQYSSMQTASNAGGHLSSAIHYKNITDDIIYFRCSVCNEYPLQAYIDGENQTIECSSCRSAYLITQGQLNRVKITRIDASTVRHRIPRFVESDNDTYKEEPFELVQESHSNRYFSRTSKMNSPQHARRRYHHHPTSLFPSRLVYLPNNHPRSPAEYGQCIACRRLVEQALHKTEEQVLQCTVCLRLYFVAVDNDGQTNTNVVEVEGSAEDSPFYYSLLDGLTLGDDLIEGVKDISAQRVEALRRQIPRENDEHRLRVMQLNEL